MSEKTILRKFCTFCAKIIGLSTLAFIWTASHVSAHELDSQSLNHGWAFTWDSPGRTLFRCRAIDSNDKAVLYGNEISFRNNSIDSSLASCRSWFAVASSLVNEKNLENIKSNSDNKNVVTGVGTYNDNNSIKFAKAHLASTEYGGWFRANGERYFSEGVYVSPLVGRPKKTVRSYSGIAIVEGNYLSIKSLTADFANNAININISAAISPPGSRSELKNTSPINFNPTTGTFTGEMVHTTFTSSGQVIRRPVGISGAIGGEGGRIIVATMHNGNGMHARGIKEPNGFDFFVAVDK